MRMALVMQRVSKYFGDVVACDDVSVTFEAGEFHALLGENGAGKSTLCLIAAGFYRADAGTVLLDGDPVEFRTPRAALDLGIGMVHQDLRLVETQTVAQNMALADPDLPFFPSRDRLCDLVTMSADRLGWELQPDRPVWQLSLGERQRVEIARILARDVRVLILDEPTTVLAPTETRSLFTTLRHLADDGVAIVFVTHKLREVMDTADRITVMRRGRVVAQTEPCDVTAEELAELMVGTRLSSPATGNDRVPPHEEEVLRVEGVTVTDEFHRPRLVDATFSVHAGEILGIAGVAGNGQRELADVIAGIRRPTKGVIHLDGRRIDQLSVRHRAERGLAYIPEDRVRTGLASGLSVAENLAIRDRSSFLVSQRQMRQRATDLLDRFWIQAESEDVDVATLSGGNKQKAICARELTGEPRLIVAAAPTRGLDVAAERFVEQLLLAERQRGAAVLLISEDLDQLFTLSDRLRVLHAGQVSAEIDPREDTARQQAGRLMAGIGTDPVSPTRSASGSGTPPASARKDPR